jgi:hypothetical protein
MARPSAQTGLDPHALFEHAEFYHKSAELLGSEIVRDMPRLAHTEYAFPQVFISTIASEVYLKCLHALEFQGMVPKDHPLDKLFGGLSAAPKLLVKRHWNAVVARDPMFKASSPRPGRRQKHDLVLALREGGLAFMRYRYAYEGKHLSSYALGNLPDVLRDVILELRPEWRV